MTAQTEIKHFDVIIRCTLKQLYDCCGVDGFDGLIENQLGHGIADTDWKLSGVDGDHVLIHVTGEVFTDDDEVAA